MDKLLATELRAERCFNQLIQYANDLIGVGRIDMQEFIDAPAPAQYMVERFAADAYEDIPKHLQEYYFNSMNKPQQAVGFQNWQNNTGITILGIEQTHQQFKTYCLRLGDKAPSIINNKLVSNLK